MFAGGGTGGHIYPALSLAKEFQRRHPEAEILFVGAKRGMENQIIPAEGYKLHSLELTYFPRKPSLEQLKTALRAARALIVTRKLLKEFSPDIVVGTGGYAAGPLLFTAALMDYPTLIHEQNAFPSLTNRWLSRFVDAIAVSHEAAVEHFPAAKVRVTGNPLRPELFKVDRESARHELGLAPETKVLVSVGGSGGAERLNRTVCDTYPVLQKEGVTLFHVTGKRYYPETLVRAASFSNVKVIDYATNMPELLAAADLVVSRAGSTTAELAYLGVPAILIPSPIAANDHQLHNARVAERAGGALLIKESALNGPLLGEIIADLFGKPDTLQKMSAGMKSLAYPRATEDLCDLLESLLIEVK